MVRAHMKQTSEKKEHKKKGPPKKPVPESGNWPCKMNGCNKVFAREADLKRHQRTTKVHSMPGFACPQCDATFTRTDALRRHQKSRHNGVVMMPEQQQDEDPSKGKQVVESNEAGSPGSKSPSRSATPTKSQGDAPSTKSTPSSSTATQPQSSGPTSYYRQHTMTQSYGPSRIIDAHYPQSIGPPTSAARLHQASWAPPAPWSPEGQAVPPGHMYAVPPPPHYYPPYYRPPPGMMPMPPPPGHPGHMGPEYMTHPHVAPNGAPYPPPPDGRSSPAEGSQEGKDSDAEMEDGSSVASAPVIDPSLEGPGDALHPSSSSGGGAPAKDGEQKKQSQVELSADAKEAVRAVLELQRLESSRTEASSDEPDAPQRSKGRNKARQASVQSQAADATLSEQKEAVAPQTQGAPRPPAPAAAADADVDVDADGEADADGDSPKGGAAEQAEQPMSVDAPKEQKLKEEVDDHKMEEIVTEDGVTMLNPAELLTQESLASPPPS